MSQKYLNILTAAKLEFIIQIMNQIFNCKYKVVLIIDFTLSIQ